MFSWQCSDTALEMGSGENIAESMVCVCVPSALGPHPPTCMTLRLLFF